ncbi:PHD-type domain-containing protein [Mycena venus]|uniref:PHD-type domain-containing protein n=1 Tax=Mycena venus TaxID=2733690 RepID=A0A8H7CK21_9AGAR|nr:PHD-type domain-containing protein [Mycena venus]
MSCRVCKKDYPGDIQNWLLTCHQCNRNWHHRCHEPPVPDTVIVDMWKEFLEHTRLNKPKWTCTKCSRKKPTTVPPAPSTRHIPETRSNRATTVSEIIDLSESPETRRPARAAQISRPQVAEIIDIDSVEEVALSAPLAHPRFDKPARVQSSRAGVAEIINLERELPPVAPLAHAPSDSASIIDLSLDSPPSVPLNLPAPSADLVLPHPVTNLPAPVAVPVNLPNISADGGGIRCSSASSPSRSPSLSELGLLETPTPANPPQLPIVATDPPSIEVDLDRMRSSLAPSASRNPSLSELVLPDTPTPTNTRLPSMDVDMDEDNIDRKPLLNLDVDETEQKPLALLLQSLSVSDRPKGGTLGPAWIRERCEASGQMAKWERLVEKQNIPKPLSRRKPEKTRFVGEFRKSFIVLPFDGNNAH